MNINRDKFFMEDFKVCYLGFVNICNVVQGWNMSKVSRKDGLVEGWVKPIRGEVKKSTF